MEGLFGVSREKCTAACPTVRSLLFVISSQRTWIFQLQRYLALNEMNVT